MTTALKNLLAAALAEEQVAASVTVAAPQAEFVPATLELGLPNLPKFVGERRLGKKGYSKTVVRKVAEGEEAGARLIATAIVTAPDSQPTRLTMRECQNGNKSWSISGKFVGEKVKQAAKSALLAPEVVERFSTMTKDEQLAELKKLVNKNKS